MGALRWPVPSAEGVLAALLKTAAKLPAVASLSLALLLRESTLLRAFWRELGRSEPMAPHEPVEVRELGREHSTSSPLRLPDPLRPESESSSVRGVGISSALSEIGQILPEEPVEVTWRREMPAFMRLCTADRLVRVAKFLLPSNKKKNMLASSSKLGGPRGCRTGCPPARP